MTGLLPALLLLGTLAGPVPSSPPDPGQPVAEEYSAPLQTAVSELVVAQEVRTGYVRARFRHWVDDDGDGCSTRVEVLVAEADDPATLSRTCRVTGGRWFSYYDGLSQTVPSSLDIDHLVPLAEAWDSGAHSWTPQARRRFANDLGDRRSLVAVTGSVNRSKSDQDPATWTPDRAVCRYLREWVAVKHRWDLSVDPAELAALTTLAEDCAPAVVSVALAAPEAAAAGTTERPRTTPPRGDRPRAAPPKTDRPKTDRPKTDRPGTERPRATRPKPRRPTNRPQAAPASTSPQGDHECPDHG